MNIYNFLSEKVNQAVNNVAGGISASYKIQIRKSIRTQFGDYQVNGIMSLAKKLNITSSELAKKIVNFLKLDGIAHTIEIVDPGFINIFLNPKWIEIKISETFCSPRLGISYITPQNIVVDYSAPNIAKEMHIGHLRSTIIGDAMVRILSFLGHNVIRANHIGDWGTQFGMLIAYLEEIQSKEKKNVYIADLDKFYREAKKKYDKYPVFAELARNYVVKLQSGDCYCRQMWKKLVDITMIHNQKIYIRLNVTLTLDDIMGESLYNDMLPNIVADLRKKGLAVDSKGAIVVFINDFKNKAGKPMGVVIQKRDGAYLYTTTDIACAKYRYEILKADRIIYYVDSRQYQHFIQVWTIVRKAGYVPKSVSLEHHIFGMVLDNNNKPFKTRSGKTIKLTTLLDEASKRASNLIISKNPKINKTELKHLANIMSIGAVKYADLSKNRKTNYVFNWDSMLNFEGNTAPYMQYAYTRIISIFRRSGQNKKELKGNLQLEGTYEIKLATRLLQFEETIIIVAKNGTPHVLCDYLYNLATLFSFFYEHCSILNAKNKTRRQNRLKLALLTARTLKQGLNLLGIEIVEQM